MRLTQWIIATIFACLLCVSLIIGQLTYRIDRTLLSYRFLTTEIPAFLEPLSDPEIHRQTVQSLAGVVRDTAGLRMPPQLVQLFNEATVQAFDPGWFEWTLTRTVYSLVGTVRGTRDDLQLPVNISGFESAFAREVRQNLPPEAVQEVLGALRELPGGFDLATAIPEPTRAGMVGFGQRYGLLFTLITYILPGILTISLFSFRRLGTAFLCGGAAYGLAGAAVLVFGRTVFLRLGTLAAEATRSALPSRMRWVTDEVRNTFSAIGDGLGQYAALIAAVGVLSLTLGLWIVIRGHNEVLDFAGASAEEDSV